MKLTPTRPPGRVTRKAAAYATEIQRLRSEGYTFEAIRASLADAGIQVSVKTVQREAVRIGTTQATAARATPSSDVAPLANPPRAVQTEVANLPVIAGSTGREIAEEFFERHHFNHMLLKAPP